MCAIYPSRESVVPTWKGQDATMHALSLRPPSPAPGPSVKDGRPGLGKCLEFLEAGDLLLVWRLDRLGRSMVHLVGLVEELQQRGVGFRSICDGAIDTTTASGELVFNIFSALAQFERRLIQERTRAGLAAARARGRHLQRVLFQFFSAGSRPRAGTPRRPAGARA